MRTIDLSGRVALVVGGGGGGIGTAVVEALAEAGADVGAVTYVEEHGIDTAERVARAGRRASIQIADVTDDAALTRAVAAVSDALGPVQYLVNVVGGARAWERAAHYDMATLDTIMARNFRYVALSCREVARRLIEQSLPGSIVNLSSCASAGYPYVLAYAGAKAAVEAGSRTMAVEWAAYGIRVNVIAPGSIDTSRGTMGPDVLQSIPLGRQGLPHEIADVALVLLSDLASYVTGQTVRVDGGSAITGPGGADSPPAFNDAMRAQLLGLRAAERAAVGGSDDRP